MRSLNVFLTTAVLVLVVTACRSESDTSAFEAESGSPCRWSETRFYYSETDDLWFFARTGQRLVPMAAIEEPMIEAVWSALETLRRERDWSTDLTVMGFFRTMPILCDEMRLSGWGDAIEKLDRDWAREGRRVPVAPAQAGRSE